ncbi:MAG: tetrahydromethanopterin S-methyltransferase [Candidatus Helarchaeota archaeon]|nr:tetrahydromethanopterin S-methyltransferase [Candidatus Helarchaeota archaeon]
MNGDDKTMDAKNYVIDGVSFGGQQGENPIVLIGSIFYSGHHIITDPEKGEFHREKAEKYIKDFMNYSQKYRIPCALDVVAETPTAMIKFLDFTLDEFDGPIILDGIYDARLRGIQHIKDLGVPDRVIYDSIWKNTETELKAIKDAGIKTAILFGYDIADSSSSKRYSVMTEGTKKYPSLLKQAEQAGITQMLVDNVITHFDSVGDVIETNIMFKNMFGVPVGCGPANISYYLDKFDKAMTTKQTRDSSLIAVLSLFSDFLLFGPIERAKTAFMSAYIGVGIKNSLKFDLFDIYKRE